MKCKVCENHINLGMEDVVNLDEVDFDDKRKIEFKLTCFSCGAIHFTYIDMDDMIETLE